MDPSVILWIAAGVLSVGLLAAGLGVEVLRGYSANRLRDLVRERNAAGPEAALRALEARLAREEALVSATQHWLMLIELALFVVLVAALGKPWEALVTRLAVAAAITIAAVVLLRRGVAGALAEHRAEEILLRLLPLLAAAAVLMRPLSVLERFVVKVVSRLMGVSEHRPAHEAIQEEILNAVDEGEREGVLAGNEARMIEGVMDLTDLDVREVMTPRTDIVWLSATATLAEAARVVDESGHSRIPVYSGSRDNVVGVLYAKDLIVHLRKENRGTAYRFPKQTVPRECLMLSPDFPENVSEVARAALFVPETKPVWALLQELLQTQVHVAIVVDEYGGTAGLITVEDILEEVVGEIADEYDRSRPPPLKRLSETAAEVDARMRVDEVNEQMAIHVPQQEDYDTVGGLAFTVLGRVPSVGEQFRVNGIDFTILEVGKHRIKRLRVESRAGEE